MNKLKWVNKTNMLACFEAGIIGKEVEEVLSTSNLAILHHRDLMFDELLSHPSAPEQTPRVCALVTNRTRMNSPRSAAGSPRGTDAML